VEGGTTDSQGNSSTNAKVKCYGGKLEHCSLEPEKFQKWAASVGEQADVVDYTIAPIYKLRDPDDPKRQRALLKAAFHSLEAKLLGGLQAQWIEEDRVASASKTDLETVAIKSVTSNRFCRLNRDDGDTNNVATTNYTIICDGNAKYNRKVPPGSFQQPGDAHLVPRVCLLPRAEQSQGGIHLAGLGAEQPQHVC